MDKLAAKRGLNLGSVILRRAVVVAAILALSVAVLTLGAKSSEAGYASIILDADTGEVLRARNADTRNYPASLTKMMTLYMLFEELDSERMNLQTKLKVSKRAAGQPASKLGLKRGETITVHEAIMALATKSANDVATVVAEAIGGTEWEFAAAMTKRAHSLGMTRTRFSNASGLPNRKQLSTARDMAILAMALLRDFPHYYGYFAAPSFTHNGVTHHTHNNLLDSYPGLDGIKTGYIRASGFNLVASAERDGRRVIAVVFGGRTAKSRDSHMVKLLDLGFERVAQHDEQSGARQFAGLRSREIPLPVPKPGTVEVGAKVETAVEAETEITGLAVKVVAGIPLPHPSRPTIGEWAIQIGAYRSVSAAETALRDASRRISWLLANASAALTPIEMKRGDILYRARFLGLDRDAAVQACDKLKAETMPCAVMPNPDLQLARNSS
jgi:D-alanyl-D-alanine carboxypeptidase